MKKKIIVIIATVFIISFFSLSLFFKNSESNNSYVCKDCNVILITMTNLRYDHLSGNGYFRPTSPNLDNLAKQSLVFDNAFSHASWTLTAGISMYTSLFPYQHKVMDRYNGKVLSSTTPTLIDILQNNGYKTAAFTGGFDYDPRFGLMNRVGEEQECTDEKQNVTVKAYGKFECTIPKAINWIKTNQNKKFFVHVQGFDAHCPFSQTGGLMYDKNYKGVVDYSQCLWTFEKTTPKIINNKPYYPVYSSTTEGKASILLGENDIKHLIALYDEAITESDSLIGSFLQDLKKLGLDKKTIVVFTSEHGDMFGKDGRFMRGGPLSGTFYDDVLHIPLFIRNPKLTGKRIDGLAQQIDILPTLLDFLAIKKDSNFAGKSLIPLVMQNKTVNKYVFTGSEFYPDKENSNINKQSRIEMIRSKEWQLIKEQIISPVSGAPTFELYNVALDKEELHNLMASDNNIANDLKSKLETWSSSIRKSN